MSLKDRFRFDELRNIAEDLVMDELERQLNEQGILHSQSNDTVQDMCAFALNLVRPMYRANLLGRVYATAFHDEYHQQISQAVSQAIERVSQNPPPGAE